MSLVIMANKIESKNAKATFIYICQQQGKVLEATNLVQ